MTIQLVWAENKKYPNLYKYNAPVTFAGVFTLVIILKRSLYIYNNNLSRENINFATKKQDGAYELHSYISYLVLEWMSYKVQ